MARYNIALATLLASKAIASEVTIDSNGAVDRSLFSKVRVKLLKFAHHEIVFPSCTCVNLLAHELVASHCLLLLLRFQAWWM